LNFNRYFSEADRDTTLQKKLVAEMPGIIAWALQGLYDLRAQGSFTVPASSTDALRSYMA
jgi:putative DNA primase/helicase